MGLDLVEYVIAVETSFGIKIPDSDAATLATPRLLIDYLASRLPIASRADSACISQRAFYRARAATARRFGVDRRSLEPRTALRDVMGARAVEWNALGTDIGAVDWPRLKGESWLSRQVGGVASLGQLAWHLATYEAAAMREPDAPWTRKEIETLVLALLETELGVDMKKYTVDSTFVRDMGLD